MSFENVESITMIAGGAISQRRFVTLNSSGRVVRATAGADALGVALVAASASGDAIAMAQLEGSRMEIESGAAIAAGAAISSDSIGRGITSTSGAAILGYAVTASAAAGVVIDIITARGSRQT